MLIASIQGYSVVLFIHILAVVVGLGTTFGYGLFIAFAQNNAPRSVPAILRAMNLANRVLVTPALLVILIAGFWLVSDRDYSLGESWISVGILAVIALGGMIHGFFVPRSTRAAEIAERDLERGDTLSPEFEALSRQVAVAGQIAGVIIVVAIFFMTVKP